MNGKRLVFLLTLIIFVMISGIVTAEENKWRIGLTSEGFGTGFGMELVNGAKEMAKQLDIELIVADGQFSPQVQVRQIENFVAQKCDLIIIHPNNAEVCGKKAEWVESKGIPVISVSMEIDPPATAFVGFNWKKAAIDQAKLFAEALKGKGNVVMIQGLPGTSAKMDRDAGMEWLLKNYPDIKLLDKKPANWNRADALKVMENFLQAYPKIDGVFSHNDDMAIGILQAIKSAGRENEGIVLVGCDGPQEALDNIKNGLQYGTIACESSKLGEQAILLASFILSQKDKKSWKYMDGQIMVPHTIVTKQNVNDIVGY